MRLSTPGSIGSFLLAAALAGTLRPVSAQDADAGSPPLRYFITSGDPETGFRASDRELAAWAFEAWARNSGGGLQVEPAALQEEALVRVFWAPADGSRYGETRPIFVGGKRGAAVFVVPDVDALGQEIAARAKQDPLWRETIVYMTCLHEIGHALGLEHTASDRDIMYFFGYGGDIIEFFARYRRQLTVRTDIRKMSGLSSSDIERLRALHGAR